MRRFPFCASGVGVSLFGCESLQVLRPSVAFGASCVLFLPGVRLQVDRSFAFLWLSESVEVGVILLVVAVGVWSVRALPALVGLASFFGRRSLCVHGVLRPRPVRWNLRWNPGGRHFLGGGRCGGGVGGGRCGGVDGGVGDVGRVWVVQFRFSGE